MHDVHWVVDILDVEHIRVGMAQVLMPEQQVEVQEAEQHVEVPELHQEKELENEEAGLLALGKNPAAAGVVALVDVVQVQVRHEEVLRDLDLVVVVQVRDLHAEHLEVAGPVGVTHIHTHRCCTGRTAQHANLFYCYL